MIDGRLYNPISVSAGLCQLIRISMHLGGKPRGVFKLGGKGRHSLSMGNTIPFTAILDGIRRKKKH